MGKAKHHIDDIVIFGRQEYVKWMENPSQDLMNVYREQKIRFKLYKSNLLCVHPLDEDMAKDIDNKIANPYKP